MTHATKGIYRYIMQDFIRVRSCVLRRCFTRALLRRVHSCFFSPATDKACAERHHSRSGGADDALFSESDVLASISSIQTVDYHQSIHLPGGIIFTPYHAGHILGAAMFMISIAGVRILYTGDISREVDRHLVPAEIPLERPDVVIGESTFGTMALEGRREKEERLLSACSDRALLSPRVETLLIPFPLPAPQQARLRRSSDEAGAVCFPSSLLARRSNSY